MVDFPPRAYANWFHTMSVKMMKAAEGRFPDLSALRVLVVDDMGFCRTLVRNLLLAAGVDDIEVAPGVNEAWRLICETPPDLLILDWELAEQSGIDLLQMIRSSPESPDPAISILMLTAYREEHRVRQAISAGITSYLTKPFTAGDFIHKVEFCVESRRRHDRTARLHDAAARDPAPDDQILLD